MDQRTETTLLIPGNIAGVVAARWPKEVVVEHADGTVSLFCEVQAKTGTIRARRAGDVFRQEQNS